MCAWCSSCHTECIFWHRQWENIIRGTTSKDWLRSPFRGEDVMSLRCWCEGHERSSLKFDRESVYSEWFAPRCGKKWDFLFSPGKPRWFGNSNLGSDAKSSLTSLPLFQTGPTASTFQDLFPRRPSNKPPAAETHQSRSLIYFFAPQMSGGKLAENVRKDPTSVAFAHFFGSNSSRDLFFLLPAPPLNGHRINVMMGINLGSLL